MNGEVPDDRRRNERSGALVFGLAAFTIALAAFLIPPALDGSLSAPETDGDGPDYDSIAWELSQGNGFSHEWDDPEFRRPYEQANADGRFDYLLAREGSYATAYRPPLLPVVTSWTYSIFGRTFIPVRVTLAAMMAAATALTAGLVYRRLGLPVGLCFLFVMLLPDDRPRAFATRLVTEPPACLLIVLATSCLIGVVENGRSPRRAVIYAALGGFALGLATFNRTLIALWVPALAAGLALAPLVARTGPGRRSADELRFREFVTYAVILSTTTVCVVLPWAFRNGRVTGELMPLGTQGAINLPVAYGDRAVERGGLWYPPEADRLYDDLAPLDGLEEEIASAKRGSALAGAWMRENAEKLPGLAAAKAWNMWRPHNKREAIFAILFLIGMAFFPDRRLQAVIVLMLFANTLAVAATWSVGGRFLMPVLPLVHVFPAYGLALPPLIAWNWIKRRPQDHAASSGNGG